MTFLSFETKTRFQGQEKKRKRKNTIFSNLLVNFTVKNQLQSILFNLLVNFTVKKSMQRTYFSLEKTLIHAETSQ